MTRPAASDRAATKASAFAPVDLRARRKQKILETLYADCWQDLCRWLTRRFGSGPPEPEEAAQSAFARLAEFDGLDHVGNPRAYLFAAASNAMLMQTRWRERTRRLVDGELAYLSLQVEDLTPERIYVERERFRALIAGVGRLTGQQREVLVRSRLLGQTYEAISAETGWSPASICRHLTRALEALEAAVDGGDAQ